MAGQPSLHRDRQPGSGASDIGAAIALRRAGPDLLRVDAAKGQTSGCVEASRSPAYCLRSATRPATRSACAGAASADRPAHVGTKVIEHQAAPGGLGEASASGTILRLRLEERKRLSETNKTRFHLPDGPAQRERDEQMASGGTDFSIKAVDWIYAHDATMPVAPTASP